MQDKFWSIISNFIRSICGQDMTDIGVASVFICLIFIVVFIYESFQTNSVNTMKEQMENLDIKIEKEKLEEKIYKSVVKRDFAIMLEILILTTIAFLRMLN